MEKYKDRVIVSMDGTCPMGCKHCYTLDMPCSSNSRKYEKAIMRAENSTANIIYLSERNENFFNEIDGLELSEHLYQKCKKDLFIITRSHLSDDAIEKLAILNHRMKQTNNVLYLATSVCAHESYGLTEDIQICPTPDARITNLKRARNMGIHTILMVRPVFPSNMVPLNEYFELIEQCEGHVDAVVTSGLIVTNSILKRLGIDRNSFIYMDSGDSSYLADLHDDSISYVNVETELQEIEKKCAMYRIPCFRHTMPALNWIAVN